MSRVGQFGVVRTNGFAGWVIRLGTRSQVNHAFVAVSDTQIVEAQPGGAQLAPIDKYPDAIWSHFDLTTTQADEISYQAWRLVGTPYNFLDIAVLALLSLGLRWRWLEHRAQSARQLICSQLVDRAYHQAGIRLYTDGRPDGEVTPGDLLLLIAQHSTQTHI